MIRTVLLGALAATAALAFGCSMGFTHFRPGENSLLYTSLFHDVINTYDEPHWLWIRGAIALDYNGDGKVEEEAVVATIQTGSRRRPGPIESAYLVICEVGPNGERTALARTKLFDGEPLADVPMPNFQLDLRVDRPLTRARAQVVKDKTTLKDAVVVYFWGDATPTTAYYLGFGLEDGRLHQILETTMFQNRPGFMVSNLDPTIEASRYGYQLVFGVSAIPMDILRKIDEVKSPPLWGHVFARDDDGVYRQADARFAEHYKVIENKWNQAYLKAVMHGLEPEELAWFEYYLGMINFCTDNIDMAVRFLHKAQASAVDPILQKGIDEALDMITG